MINLSFKNNKAFWIAHFSGWMGYFLLYFFTSIIFGLAPPALSKHNIIVFLSDVVIFCSGFLICLFLKYVYDKINIDLRPFPYIISAVVLFSLLSSHVIWLMVELINFLLAIFLPTEHTHFFDEFYFDGFFFWSNPFLIWSLVYFSTKFLNQWKSIKQKADITQALEQNTNLESLRYQLKPEYMFETLDSIYQNISSNNDNAKAMITELSEYLRYSLLANKSRIPLGKVLEVVENYLSLEIMKGQLKIAKTFKITSHAEDHLVSDTILPEIIDIVVRSFKEAGISEIDLEINGDVLEKQLSLEINTSFDPTETNSKVDSILESAQIKISEFVENSVPEMTANQKIKTLNNASSFNVLLTEKVNHE